MTDSVQVQYHGNGKATDPLGCPPYRDGTLAGLGRAQALSKPGDE